jgi:hypothetical protein
MQAKVAHPNGVPLAVAGPRPHERSADIGSPASDWQLWPLRAPSKATLAHSMRRTALGLPRPKPLNPLDLSVKPKRMDLDDVVACGD